MPTVPWLGAAGPRIPTPGDYQVAIQCVGGVTSGCARLEGQATATFHVVQPSSSRCVTDSCAGLQFTPNSGPPGTLVKVSGWAPLTSLDDDSSTYSLVLRRGTTSSTITGEVPFKQSSTGDIAASFRLPVSLYPLSTLTPGAYSVALEVLRNGSTPAAGSSIPGVTITPDTGSNGAMVRITQAVTPLQITQAPVWSSLPQTRPLRIEFGDERFGSTLATDPRDPKRLAYCTPNGIRESRNAGASWRTIADTAVKARVSAAGYAIFTGPSGGSNVLCDSVTLDSQHPQSFYAAFSASKDGGPPPTFELGYVTADGGKTWTDVPIRAGVSRDQFGGFVSLGASVGAFFDLARPGAPFTFIVTADGGASWNAALLPCPGAGPCVRWGPAPSMIGGMGAPSPQAIVASADNGATWFSAAWPDSAELKAPGPHQLVALAPDTIALIDGGEGYPLRVSRDGGRTWVYVELPASPGSSDDTAFVPALQMLPDGSLLSQGQAWYLLRAGATSWCTIKSSNLPIQAVALPVAGDRAWWLASPDDQSGALELSSTPLVGLSC